jgi:hypothetical protein
MTFPWKPNAIHMAEQDDTAAINGRTAISVNLCQKQFWVTVVVAAVVAALPPPS